MPAASGNSGNLGELTLAPVVRFTHRKCLISFIRNCQNEPIALLQDPCLDEFRASAYPSPPPRWKGPATRGVVCWPWRCNLARAAFDPLQPAVRRAADVARAGAHPLDEAHGYVDSLTTPVRPKALHDAHRHLRVVGRLPHLPTISAHLTKRPALVAILAIEFGDTGAGGKIAGGAETVATQRVRSAACAMIAVSWDSLLSQLPRPSP